MSERIILQDLVDLLSERKNITKKDAEAFLRELIALISESIEKDEVVKIKDFGGFKLVKVNSRKSVNVNTGESIEIPAHYKVSFTPDKTLRERINAPFAHFESVVLEDGVTFDNATSIAGEIAGLEEETVQDDIVAEETATPAPPESIIEESSIETETIVVEEEPDDQIEELVEDATFIENQEPVAVDNEVSANQEEDIIVQEDFPVTDDVTDEEDNNVEDIGISAADIVEEAIAKEEVADVINDEEPTDQEDIVHEDEALSEINAEDKDNQEEGHIETEQDDSQYEGEDLYEKSSKKKIFIGILVALFAILVVVGWLYRDTIKVYVNDKGLFGSKRVTVASYSVADEAVLLADSLSNANRNDSIAANNLIQQPATTIKISYGDTMRKLGLEHYGHKVFWVYIYEENKSVIKDPNNVPIGTELIIPLANKYGIDANNPESIEKAKKLEAMLFSRL